VRKLTFTTILLVGIILFAGTIEAAERHVPSQYVTIQVAINDCNNGDVVIIAPGTYTGEGNRDIDFLGKAITVRSTDPNDPCVITATIINCQGSTPDRHRGFNFHSGEDNNSLIEGLTITNGVMNYGGGICCEYSSPTIQKNIITGNYAIWVHEIPGYGGGIYCDNSSAVISGNVITHNSVDVTGGGIFAYESSLIIKNNIITDNDAYGHANVIFPPGCGASGGGISCSFASLVIANNTISGNHAHDFNEPPLFFPGTGGGIESGYSSLTIVNTVVWGDSPNEIIFNSTTINSTYSDVQGGWSGAGNIDSDPCFANTSSGDYHLKSQAGRWNPSSQSWVIDANTSPCIDAGNPGCPLGDEPGDANNVRIDMGAYGGTAEASKTPANWRSITDLTNDWAVDINDLGVFVGYWLDSGECIPSDLNRNQLVNFADYAIFAQQWLGGSL
jgi:hypothetical protein